MTTKLRFVVGLVLTALCGACGNDREETIAAQDYVFTSIEYRIVALPSDLSSDLIGLLLLRLHDEEAEEVAGGFSWIPSCGYYMWSYDGISSPPQLPNSTPAIRTDLLERNLVVARDGDREWILVHTDGIAENDEYANTEESPVPYSVSVEIAWSSKGSDMLAKAQGRRSGLVPAIAMTHESAFRLSDFTGNHVGRRAAVVLDGCFVGVTKRISHAISVQLLTNGRFFIEGDFEVADVRSIIERLRPKQRSTIPNGTFEDIGDR